MGALLGVDPMVMTPRAFDAYVQKEIVEDAALVRTAGVKIQ
jgi:tripartite-type tricarboxylate transporter receptor subunit TctC